MPLDPLAQARVDATSMPDQRSELVPSPRWVRAKLGHVTVADSKRVMLLRETGRLPVYYFPEADVRTDLLAPSGHTVRHPRFGEATFFDLAAGGQIAAQAAWTYRDVSTREACENRQTRGNPQTGPPQCRSSGRRASPTGGGYEEVRTGWAS